MSIFFRQGLLFELWDRHSCFTYPFRNCYLFEGVNKHYCAMTIVPLKKKKHAWNLLLIQFLLIILAAIMLVGCQTNDLPPGPKVYVANEGDSSLSVIDAQSLKVTKTIHLDGMPHNVNVDPQGMYFYATNHEEEDPQDSGEGHEDDGHKSHVPYLRILDAGSRKLLRSVPMTHLAAHVVPSRSGQTVFVSREGGSTIVEVDVNEGKILRTFEAGLGPHGFVLSHDSKIIYAPNMRSNDVSIIDRESGESRRLNITFKDYRCQVAVAMGITADDAYSFVTCGRSFDLYKIDNKKREVVGRIAFKKGEFPGPIQTPVHPSGKFLYVPDMRNGVVHKIDLEKFEFIQDIPTGDGAHGIAFSLDGKTAYVTNTWEDTLAVLDLDAGVVRKKIKVGKKPNGVAVSNGKNQGW